MDKLYTAIFGVYMGSPEDDLTEFIEIVKSVIGDDQTIKSNYSPSWSWLIISIFFIVLVLLLIYLYLKVVW
ncbi:imv membrane protein [Raccoonpox virus]|uniref:Protein OPG078 n=1 Tax=Raccoon poxvirus TaxID=10256 RepID=A0A0G3FXM0_RACVI|nr:IMV membrane protein [Raccoonpox virus]AKJ93700.1 IMV membrane protein [Raccoonpox virus]AOP31332.1 imv membrane protein [Raccoonpox virus]